ncbi:MAG: hypothetical protein EOO60_14215, partial [Hymenobacter sp.]
MGWVIDVECRVEIDPFAAANGKQRLLLTYFAPSARAAGLVSGVGHIDVMQHCLASLNVGFEHGQLVQKVSLRLRIGRQGTGVVSL